MVKNRIVIAIILLQVLIKSLNVQSVNVVINEIMADPEPAVGLPSAEYVELYNAGSEPIELDKWTFKDRSTDVQLSSFLLEPGSYVILCAESDLSLFKELGRL